MPSSATPSGSALPGRIARATGGRVPAARPASHPAAAADLKAADLTPPPPPGVRRPWSLPDPRPHSRNALSRKSQRRRHRAAAGTAARCRAQQSAASSAVEKKPRFMTFLLTIISALKGLRMPRI